MFELVTLCKDCKNCEATQHRFAGRLCDYCVQKRHVADLKYERSQLIGYNAAIGNIDTMIAHAEAKLDSMTPKTLTITDLT